MTHAKTHVKNFDPRKNLFDSRKPRKNYGLQKMLNWVEFFYFKLAQIYIKNIAHIIYV